MKYSILSSESFNDDKKINEAINEFMTPIDVLVINESPKLYEKIAAMIVHNKGINIHKRPNPQQLVDYTIIIYDDGAYEKYPVKRK